MRSMRRDGMQAVSGQPSAGWCECATRVLSTPLPPTLLIGDGCRLPSDPLGGEHLHGVAFGDVVPTVEQDAALEAFSDLAHVVLLAHERGDAAVPEPLPVAQVAHAVATMNHAVGDDAAGDHAAAGLERGAHLGLAVHHLL